MNTYRKQGEQVSNLHRYWCRGRVSADVSYEIPPYPTDKTGACMLLKTIS